MLVDRHGRRQPGRQRLPGPRVRGVGVGLEPARQRRRLALPRRRVDAAGAGDRGGLPAGRVVPVPLAGARGDAVAVRRRRPLRPAATTGSCASTAALYAVASVVAFLVPVAARRQPDPVRHVRRRARAAGARAARGGRSLALAPLLLFWQWSPAFDAILRAGDDPSVERSYYAPLIGHLASVGAENRRTEIVPTARHWETAFVAARYPIARGWERQLDIRFNGLFYDDDLTAADVPRLAARRGRRPRRPRRRPARRRRRAGGGADRAAVCRSCGRSGPTATGGCGRSSTRPASSTVRPTVVDITADTVTLRRARAPATSRCGSVARRSGAPIRRSASSRPTTAGSCCATSRPVALEVFLAGIRPAHGW